MFSFTTQALIRTLAEEHKGNVNLPGDHASTALHKAVESGALETITIRNSNNETPLLLAYRAYSSIQNFSEDSDVEMDLDTNPKAHCYAALLDAAHAYLCTMAANFAGEEKEFEVAFDREVNVLSGHHRMVVKQPVLFDMSDDEDEESEDIHNLQIDELRQELKEFAFEDARKRFIEIREREQRLAFCRGFLRPQQEEKSIVPIRDAYLNSDIFEPNTALMIFSFFQETAPKKLSQITPDANPSSAYSTLSTMTVLSS